MTETTQEHLNKVLWNAADSSRTSLDASVYKDYVLAMLFFKYLSDLAKKEQEKLKERLGDDEARIQEKMKSGRFYLPPNTSFDYIYGIQEKDEIGQELNKVLQRIEDNNKGKLEGIFSGLDFNSESILGKVEQRNKMIRHLIHDFHKIDLRNMDDDVIGNSYMYMISKFGSEAGKKAGEFFTSKGPATLLAKLAQPKDGDRICDPACGSGGLLLLAGAEKEKQDSKKKNPYG